MPWFTHATLASYVRLVQRANRHDQVVRVWLPSADTAGPKTGVRA